MSEYQLELKQIVDYPRCRIYRQFIGMLMNDKNIRINGSSGLYYFTVLSCYANFRTSYKRIDGISYTIYPGEWLCRVSELTEWFRTRFQHQALSILKELQDRHLITYTLLGRGKLVKFKIKGWCKYNRVLDYNAPCQKDTGFFFLPISVANELVSAGRCSEMDAMLDLWVNTIYNDTQVQGSDVGPVVYMRNGTMSEQQLLELAAYAEDYSNHPISLSIKNAYGGKIDSSRISDVQEIAGHGVQAVIDGRKVLAGNAKLMKKENIKFSAPASVGTVVYLACDGKYAGCIIIEDEIKPDAQAAMKSLKSSGVRRTVMLTGDADAVGRKVAARLGLDQAYTELLPADKVARVEDMLKQKSEKGKLVFVGDGINDAPVLARADVGIAMGGLGSDAAIEAADVVLMTDEPSKIATVMKIARKTLRIAHQNIVFALLVKVLVLVIVALGHATMWHAVFADVGVSVIAILNAIRAMKVKHMDVSVQG